MRQIILGALMFAVGAATVAALTTWRQPTEGESDPAVITSPQRTAPAPPVPSPPPPVPGQAAVLQPITYTLRITWSTPTGRETTTQEVTRTRDRVRIGFEGGHQEWLFVQNAAYPDRASGYLIDHRAHQIRLHEESTLQSALGIRGWADVLTMRFEPRILSTLRNTGQYRLVDDVTFARFIAQEPNTDGVVEVWWSDEILLPLSFTTRESGTEVTSVVAGISRHTEESLLAEPAFRFPQYENRDAADAVDH